MANERDHTWVCRYCHEEFDSMLELDDHVATAHKAEEHPAAKASQKPGVEPADQKVTTELPPGVKAARQ
jgi:hypothetical protein